MIRPQKKRLDEENAMLAALGKGDEIYTKAGILGTVVGMTDKVITLEVAEGVKFKVLRSQIGGLAKKIFEAAENKTEAKK
jgi:preprotein translocase subunit YajC